MKRLCAHNAQVKKARKITTSLLEVQAAFRDFTGRDTTWEAEEARFAQDQEQVAVGEIKVWVLSSFWEVRHAWRRFEALKLNIMLLLLGRHFQVTYINEQS